MFLHRNWPATSALVRRLADCGPMDMWSHDLFFNFMLMDHGQGFPTGHNANTHTSTSEQEDKVMNVEHEQCIELKSQAKHPTLLKALADSQLKHVALL